MKPDGVFLSNGPGDPAETGKYAVPVIQQVINSGTPTFGICLGHQMLAWRSAPRPGRCIRAITAPIIRSGTRPPARWKSPR